MLGVEPIDEIINKIRTGKITLFVGSGMGKNCDPPLPDGNDLTKIYLDLFPQYQVKDDKLGFTELAEKILRDNRSNRKILEDTIYENLSNAKFSKYHRIISWYSWRAIFTTNYDDLIEKSYADKDSTFGIKTFTQNHEVEFSVRPPDRIPLYKIHGSLKSKKDEKLIITEGDMTVNFQERHAMFETLMNLAMDGNLLFIGYSFDDNIIYRILDYLADKYGLDKVPPSYAILHSEPDEKKIKQLKNRKISPIVIDTITFFDNLTIQLPPIDVRNRFVFEDFTLTISNEKFTLRGIDFLNFENYYELISDKSISEPEGSHSTFFSGSVLGWGPYRVNWDFQREIYDKAKGINNLIQSFVNSGEQLREIIEINGPPGSGKSTLLRRVMFDAYTELQLPTVLGKPHLSRVNIVDEFLDIVLKIRKILRKNSKTLPPLLIGFDNAISYKSRIRRLLLILASQGISFIIILVDRQTKYNHILDVQNNPLINVTRFSLNLEFSNNEKLKFLEYMNRLEFFEYDTQAVSTLIDDLDKSFFATMYELIEDSRKPLKESVLESLDTYSSDIIKVIQIICLIKIFALDVPKSLIYQIYKGGYLEFEKNILQSEGSLFQVYTTSNDIDYLQVHHRIIAEIVIEASRIPIANLFQIIMDNIFASQLDQRVIIETILIEYLGANGNWNSLVPEPKWYEKAKIFELASEKFKNSKILHHWALLESRRKNFDKAIIIMRRAFKANKEGLPYDGDPDFVLYNSLGVLYAKKARSEIISGNLLEATKSLQSSETQFKLSKVDVYNSGSFAAEAKWGKYKIALVVSDEIIKKKLLTEGISLVLTGKGISRLDDIYRFNFIYAHLIRELSSIINTGDQDELYELARSLYETQESISGYIAAIALSIGSVKGIKDISDEKLEFAKMLINEAKEFFASKDEILLYEIWLKILSNQELYKLEDHIFADLSIWYYQRNRLRNIFLEFTFMKENGLRGDWGNCNSVASNLRLLTLSRYDNKDIIDTVLEESGKPKIFHGIVIRINKLRFNGQIRLSDQFGTVFFEMKDRDLAVGNGVYFKIGFNLLGPVAYEIAPSIDKINDETYVHFDSIFFDVLNFEDQDGSLRSIEFNDEFDDFEEVEENEEEGGISISISDQIEEVETNLETNIVDDTLSSSKISKSKDSQKLEEFFDDEED